MSNIERTIKISTIAAIKITTFRRSDHAVPIYVYTCEVIPATIEAKIRIEIPLAIPFSVINSHSHTSRIEPTESVKAVIRSVPASVAIACPPRR